MYSLIYVLLSWWVQLVPIPSITILVVGVGAHTFYYTPVGGSWCPYLVLLPWWVQLVSIPVLFSWWVQLVPIPFITFLVDAVDAHTFYYSPGGAVGTHTLHYSPDGCSWWPYLELFSCLVQLVPIPCVSVLVGAVDDCSLRLHERRVLLRLF